MEVQLGVIWAVLLVGAASGAHITGRTPYWLGYNGGVTLYVHGRDFSVGDFNQFDSTVGNRVFLVNRAEVIECEVNRYLTTSWRIVCNSGPRLNLNAPEVYSVVVYVNGELASGTAPVQYGWWVAPRIQTVTPRWSLPGAVVKYWGYLQSNRHHKINASNPEDNDPNSGNVITKVFLGGVGCDMMKPDETLYGALTYNELWCKSNAKVIGPMNSTVYVTNRGSSMRDKWGLYVNSQDQLFQHHTYAAVYSVSPALGSSEGWTLISLNGTGFDPTPGKTEVKVGGAECVIDQVTDDTITCFTPPEELTSPGPGERGLLVEVWEGTTLNNIYSVEEWETLNTSMSGYTSYVPTAPEMMFDIEIDSPSVGKVSGFLHAPHNGRYAMGAAAGDGNYIMMATNGNPDNKTVLHHWTEFYMEKDTPAYFEIRFSSVGTKMFKLYLKDIDALFVYSQARQASNEKHRFKFRPSVGWEMQSVTTEGDPGPAQLFINGFMSETVDICNGTQVSEALMDMFKQKCITNDENPSSDTKHETSFEDDDSQLPGSHGNVVDDIFPYCGMKAFKLSKSVPRVYKEGNEAKMVDVNTYRYMCFAVKGDLQSNMSTTFRWRDNRGRNREDTLWFKRTSTSNTWTYHCDNLMEVVESSWFASQYIEGAKLKVKEVRLPIPATGDVYIDQVAFISSLREVTQTYPSAVKQNGILVDSVDVEGEHCNYTLTFTTTNCMSGMPLLGIFTETPNSSWIGILNSVENQSFSINDVQVNVTRKMVATSPVRGTFDLHVQGTDVKGIPVDVAAENLDILLETALATNLKVSKSGTCRNSYYDIEWLQDPGRKELVVVDDSSLVFDGTNLDITVSRIQEGRMWHDGIASDFLSVNRDEPHVAVLVNGYRAACLGDCAYSYDDTATPSLTSVSGTPSEALYYSRSAAHTITITGTGFSSSDIADYAVTVGGRTCTVTSVTPSTEVICEMDLWGGQHEVILNMQPVGRALSPTPLIYTVPVTLSSVTPNEGGTGGRIHLTVSGSGFPDEAGWEAGQGKVMVGGKDCEIISGGSSEVTCMAPPHDADGAVDVVVEVGGSNATLSSAFTYDSSLSPAITSLSIDFFSVYGLEELTITGQRFGSPGTVKIGSESCDITSWSQTSVTCQTPSLPPATHTLVLQTDTQAATSTNAVYQFAVTSASLAAGSIKGGTILKVGGQGFGTNCSHLEVKIGDHDVCEVIECSDTSLTCITKLVATNHMITNDEKSVSWSPSVLVVREGDIVTWNWSMTSSVSEVEYSVCEVADPFSGCAQGGFNSGPKTPTGSFSQRFQQKGDYHYASLSDDQTVRGLVKVVRPSHQAQKVIITLGGQAATQNISGSQSVDVDGCNDILESLIDGCNVTDPSTPDDGHLYFLAHTCLTPVITAINTSSDQSVQGLSMLQVQGGKSLTISGSGFGESTCQTLVMVGDAACTVTSSNDTSVTCDLNDLDNLRAAVAFPVIVRVINRGVAATDLEDFSNMGQVVVVPVVTSFNPTQGSLAGGTLLTLTGFGLQPYSGVPSVFLGNEVCEVQDITPTNITCLTSASSAGTVPLQVFYGSIPAQISVSPSTYTYSEAATPSLSSAQVEGGASTLTGEKFGSDTSKITVTYERVTPTHQKRDLEEEEMEEEKRIIKVEEEEDDDYIDDFKDDEEMELLMKGYTDESEESTADAIRIVKSKRMYRRRLNLALPADLDEETSFWGSFTGIHGATFRETVRMGMWRMGGSSPSRKEENQEAATMAQRLRHATRELPTSYECPVTSANDTQINCDASAIPAGSYNIKVSVAGVGNAMDAGVGPVTNSPAISSITPEQGSINGGALLTISGSGFIPGETEVTIGVAPCPVETESATEISCRVPPGSEGGASVGIVVSATAGATSPTDFTYSSAHTPVLNSVTPSTGVTTGTSLTLSGTGFKLSGSDPEVTVDGEECQLASASDTSISCTAPALAGGMYSVVVRDVTFGDSNDISISYSLTLASVTPSSGSFGGVQVTVTGEGFDPAGGSVVTFCGAACDPVASSPASTTTITCITPSRAEEASPVVCDVVVTNPDDSNSTLVEGFTYDPTLTPTLTSVMPKRGGTAGGTTLTIKGTNFAESGNQVTIGGSPCVVTFNSTDTIICVTEAHAGPGEFAVKVDVPSKGLATTNEDSIFFYIDRWSSVYTWGGEPVPSEGQLVVIDEGQTVLLDESTEVLKMLLIKGGHVVFDDEAIEELVLRAEYILIVDGGSLSVGSEEDPFMGDAVIELYGNIKSIELPHYGAKVLAVRNGTLDLHGAPVSITWTHLASTASPGDTIITLKQCVGWKANDTIVIAGTQHRFFENQNEVRNITSVSPDGCTLTLNNPLEYQHISIEQNLGGRTIETRAEVGLLSHNVKIRGAINKEFVKEIEKCGEKWNPGQFATQSCFNGRFGDEIATDQFGATVMLTGKEPDKDLVKGRIEYIEVTEAGQAFQLGRYPLHFHLVGNVNTSYIRGCSVHRTYNRAVTIHAANNLTVEHNVVYDNMGHAIFTEDGVEMHNVIQYNLAVFTRSSSSLLNVDVTPASYWIVNPNNIVRHNAAAGGTHFGYWYRLDRHPSGPSATNSYCQNTERMGEFFNNTAHSYGRYGLWVFSMAGYHPKSGTNCRGRNTVAKWQRFKVWSCERGAEIVSGTGLQFYDFVALDNEIAGLEMVRVFGGFGEDDGPGIFNSTVIGHSQLSPDICSDGTSGIVAPKMEIFSISDTTFVNYDTGKCSALSGCSQCKLLQGGYRVQVKGLSFISSPNRVRYSWQHETAWIDADGSLTGEAESTVVPSMGILPTGHCVMDVPAFSVNPTVPGSVCDNEMKFVRFNIKGTKTEPNSLRAIDLIVSNSNGNVSVPYRVKRLTTEGWMGLLYTGDTFKWEFENANQITNITYEAQTRFMEPNDFYYVKHEFFQSPDGFSTTKVERNSTDGLPNPSTDIHGDYYWNNDTRELTYMVSYNVTADTGRSVVFDERGVGETRNIKFEVYRCKYENCIPPTPPPVPTGRPNATFKWSDKETWKEVPVGSGGHPTEDEYDLPKEGDEIIIPQGMWLIVDTVTPSLGRVYVYGGLEFDDTMDHIFNTTIIYIQGGSVVAGHSEDEPFTHNLRIHLRGSLDPTDPDNIDFPTPPGVPNVGWKAIGVFGSLKLHGQVLGKTWHKLGATAEAGTNTLTLAEAADPSLNNKMVVVTTTSKEATHSEVKRVIAVNGATLTLEDNLAYQHLGETHTLSSGNTVTLAGEVGLLSHNIVVEGNTYENFDNDNFGGRIVVSKLTQDDVPYVGSAQLDGVELRNMGQRGFTDTDDPRYSLAFVGLGDVGNSSYVKRSSFSVNHNIALGLFGTSTMEVEDNVIYHAIDSCVNDDSGSNSYTRNLLTTVQFRAALNERAGTQNLEWYGAFDLNNAPNTALIGNVVAGAEQVGFMTYGELCEDQTVWENNEVHGTTYGVLAWRRIGSDEMSECRRLNNFYAWRVTDTAFYVQHYASSVITNVTSVDSLLGVNQLIFLPPALTHNYYPKTATISDSLFVGASPSHTCDFHSSSTDIRDFYSNILWPGGVNGGSTGILFATFMSSKNLAPKHAFHPTDSYPALGGSTHITDVTFANFNDRSCGRDIAMMANPASDDAIHPIFSSGIQFADVHEDNHLFIARASVGKVNPSDCVDMDCDGLKKVVLRDMDGSLLGSTDATLISEAEFEWDENPKRGVGDYRIPVSLQIYINGSRIPEEDKFPNKGIVRDDSCSLNTVWQAWTCTNMGHRMLIIESLDSDTEVRRLSPIGLIANPGPQGYVDLLNGPMDRGWCEGYTCQERISTFYSVVAVGYIYEVAMTSTPPQMLRLRLLHTSPNEAVIFRIFFPKLQRYNVYVGDTLKYPTNYRDIPGYHLYPDDPNSPEKFFPNLTNPVGTNYLQRDEKLLHVVLKGEDVITIKTDPTVVITAGTTLNVEDIYEENIVENMASLLGVKPENIRVTNITREDSRTWHMRQAKEEVKVNFEVASASTTTLNSTETSEDDGDFLSFERLRNMMKNLVNCFQNSSCADVDTLEVNEPVTPPPPAPPKASRENGSVIIEGGELFSDKQQREEATALNKSLEAIQFDQPTTAILASGVPSGVTEYTLFETPPVIIVLDADGNPVMNLGTTVDPWVFTAELSGGHPDARLMGDTTVPYVDGAANFTNLYITMSGMGYNLTFTVTEPEMELPLSVALNETFSVQEKVLSLDADFPPDSTYVLADHPYNITLSIVDAATGNPILPEAFKDQVIVGEVISTDFTAGSTEVIRRFSELSGGVSSITLEDLIFPNTSTRTNMVFNTYIFPGGWFPTFHTPNFTVYPADMEVDNSTVKTVKTMILGGKRKHLEGNEAQLEDKILQVLLDEVKGVVWGPVTLLELMKGKARFAEIMVTGSEDAVDEAVDSLCSLLKNRTKIWVTDACSRMKPYKMRNLFVDGKFRKCK